MLTPLLRGTTALVCLSLAMPATAQEDPVFLGTLIVTPGKRDLSYGSAVSRTVLDEEEIADRQAATIAQLIDSVPGVTLVNGTTPQGSGINIRGFGANTTYGSDQKIAVIIDGASVGSEELYRIGTQLFTDPMLYREVEVLRGTIGSFAYGSGIVGGVVLMETKDGADFTDGEPGFGGSQTFEYRSNGDGLASATNLAWSGAQGADFLLNYTIRDQDDLTSGDGETIGNSSFQMPSYLLKGTFTFGQDDAHSLRLSHSGSVADDKNVPYDQFATAGGMFGNVDRLTETVQTALEYRYVPGSDLLDLRAVLSYADQQIDSDYIDGSSPLQGGTSAEDFCASPSFGVICADNRYQTTKLTISNRMLLDTGTVAHDMLAGVELIHKERRDANSSPGGTDNRIAAFVVNEMSLGNLTVTPALRYESSRIESSEPLAGVSDTYEHDALIGGLALAYEFNDGFAVFGSVAYTEGLPIIDDLGTTEAAQLKMDTSEKSETVEFGASYTGDGVLAQGDNLTIRGNFYQTRLRDITSFTASGSTGNLKRIETEGVELETSYGLESGFYADLASHVGEGTETNPNNTETQWRNMGADRVRLTLGRKWDDMLDVSWEIVHGTDSRDSSGNSLPDVTLQNLRATWRLEQAFLDGTVFRAGVENLFDEDYVGHLSAPDRKAPGRSFNLTVTKAF